MRAQVMMEGGPYDEQIIPVSTQNGEWPIELRIAPYGTFEGKVVTELYRYVEVVKVEMQRVMYVGTYRYIGNKTSAVTLVNVWTKE